MAERQQVWQRWRRQLGGSSPAPLRRRHGCRIRWWRLPAAAATAAAAARRRPAADMELRTEQRAELQIPREGPRAEVRALQTSPERTAHPRQRAATAQPTRRRAKRNLAPSHPPHRPPGRRASHSLLGSAVRKTRGTAGRGESAKAVAAPAVAAPRPRHPPPAARARPNAARRGGGRAQSLAPGRTRWPARRPRRSHPLGQHRSGRGCQRMESPLRVAKRSRCSLLPRGLARSARRGLARPRRKASPHLRQARGRPDRLPPPPAAALSPARSPRPSVGHSDPRPP
mmetsp:Transcript_14583/g.43039  ORF Transcript_14583/g.43039 Transcript_14583/m.43039 type:complete len:285 (-) Transcript_14583:87-941(-)